ncbi:MAG: hypothetical protein EON92_11015 [Burkholderiales bacterium]|nr:MAG: hypothetical protein EON92_11015 [Burkholderiales bacterium]
MLISRLFSANARLCGCAQVNEKHVQRGDKGEHVALVQYALVIIENADIAEGEMAASSYGPSTADAVLGYKTRRKIVNLSYQKKPDNIVGIMTVRALDLEIAAIEKLHGFTIRDRPGNARQRAWS